jgi:peptidoglycan/xylan/chitin deacetylase (PgdA/CDA1 family)
MRKTFIHYLVPTLLIILTGCSFPLFEAPTATPTFFPATTFTPTIPATPTQTATPLPTSTPEPTLTPTWIYTAKGQVIVPILLYHKVLDGGGPNDNCYCVSTSAFMEQMQWLYDHGYTTIPVSRLVDVILNGGELPARPVAITFDDGMMDIYTTSYPIMRQFGFIGTLFLVAGWSNGQGIVPNTGIQEMIANGWEIGDHSMTHFDLSSDYSQLRYQMFDSKQVLQDTFGVPVDTIAYPFGVLNSSVVDKAIAYGYKAGLALGRGYTQNINKIFELTREEVRLSYDMSQFIALLPWQ